MRQARRLSLVALVLAAAEAPAAPHTLTVKDTIGRAWEQEPINWELTLAPGEFRGGPVRVQRDGKPVPAQADVLAAHADGSAKTVTVRVVIDALARDATTQLTADLGEEGPPHPALTIVEEQEALVLDNGLTAARVLNRNVDKAAGGEFSPLLAVRLPSGTWTGSGSYVTETAKPVGSRTDLLGRGPARLAARVTTTFDNGRTHTVTVALWAGSRAIEIDESFDVGPESMYRFKEYKSVRDELAWEWWSWYGDKDGVKETHPNYWTFTVNGEAFHPQQVTYYGDMATDPDKGSNKERGQSTYVLPYAAATRLEKYLSGTWQWRPDATSWIALSTGTAPNADALALFTHSLRHWRNPNVLPTPQGITLRTGANDIRLRSYQAGKRLTLQCPIGLGRRCWAIRPSTVGESLAAGWGCKSVLDAERLQRQFGLDIVRQWVTDWPMTFDYPRIFIKPQEKEAYFARLRGKGIDSPGNCMDTFLRNQDQAGFDVDWRHISAQADSMLAGYFSGSGVEGYPAWMLGYWHGIIVASGLDNLLGSPLCRPEQARELKKKLAILTYCLTTKDAWPDKQINYGWGSMNMPVGRWGGLVVMASALSDHPLADEWLKDTGHYFNMLLETEFAPDGSHISCPHYIGASSTTFYAWIALANSGKFEDVSTQPILKNFARYYMQLMKPIDPRWGIRVLLNEGDTRPGSSPFPAILATLFRKSDPQLAGELMQMWIEGGRDVSLGMGVPDSLIIDPTVAPRQPSLGPQVFPGFGAFLRYRAMGTPEEAYLAFVGGNFMIDHANTDQFGFAWNEKGVPLTDFEGALYQPCAMSAVSHTTLAWDVQAGGAPDPGKGKPGNWYHDRNQPYVDLDGKTPRLHWQIGFDEKTQKINETRGLVTYGADTEEAALLQGQLRIKAMTEFPTRMDNYAVAIANQAWPPTTPLAKPFTWTRRLLYVKAPAAAGMNYLVIRDDLDGYADRTPFFHYWSFSEAAEFAGSTARLKGQFGVDTDIFVAAPQPAAFFQDTFVHDQCEPIVSTRHRERQGKAFSEKQLLCRIEGQKGKGFLVVLFPYKQGEERPLIAPWAGDAGVRVSWKGETHYIVLDTREHEVSADGINAKASALVVKVKDTENASVSLPAGGTAQYGTGWFGKLKVQAAPNQPAGKACVAGDRREQQARRLNHQPLQDGK